MMIFLKHEHDEWVANNSVHNYIPRPCPHKHENAAKLLLANIKKNRNIREVNENSLTEFCALYLFSQINLANLVLLYIILIWTKESHHQSTFFLS